MDEFGEIKNESTKDSTIENEEIMNKFKKDKGKGGKRKAIICIIIIGILMYGGVFIYEKINGVKLELKTGIAFTEKLQNDIKIATLNKDGTKLILKIKGKKAIQKINFVNELGKKIGEIEINNKDIDKILDVPRGTKFLNVSYVNEKDNKVLVVLDEEKTYIDIYEKEKEIFVLLKNRAMIKKVEYYVDTKLYEAKLEGGQILNEMYIPLEVEELIIENGFGEVITLNIKDSEVIEKNSLRTEKVGFSYDDFLGIQKGDYNTVINVVNDANDKFFEYGY